MDITLFLTIARYEIFGVSTWAVVGKILVSVKFVSAILGPEMAAPILWAPRISAFFLHKNLHVHKIPRFGEGGIWGLGGGECQFHFYGRGDFSEIGCDTPSPFLSVSPLESMQSGGAIPHAQKVYLSDTCAIPYENRANGCDAPSAILPRKGIARYGGVSRTGPLSSQVWTIIIFWRLQLQLHFESLADLILQSYNTTFTCCFLDLLVFNEFLRFWPSQTDWNWLKLTETDWWWLKMTENRSKWTDSRQESGRKPLK